MKRKRRTLSAARKAAVVRRQAGRITNLYPQVEAAIRELHDYDQPEILAVAVVAGSRGYLDWLDAETGEP